MKKLIIILIVLWASVAGAEENRIRAFGFGPSFEIDVGKDKPMAGAEERMKWDKSCAEECTFDGKVNDACFFACQESRAFIRKTEHELGVGCHYTYEIVEARSGVMMGAEWEFMGVIEDSYWKGDCNQQDGFVFRKKICK